MIVFDPRALDARERARWKAALDQRPVLAVRTPPIPAAIPLALVACGLFVLIAFARQWPPESLEPHVTTLALVVAVAAASLSAAASMFARNLSLSSSPHRCGSFLYRWGYAEVRPTRIVVVPGADITSEISIGRPRTSGASEIEITLRAPGWSETFSFRGSELDVPRDALDALARTPMHDLDGYREKSGALRGSSRRRLRDVPPALSIVAPACAAAALGFAGCLVVMAWSLTESAGDLVRAHEVAAAFPWFPPASDRVRSLRATGIREARARIEQELAPRYRDALLGFLDSSVVEWSDAPLCWLDRADASAIDEYVFWRGFGNSGWRPHPMSRRALAWPLDVLPRHRDLFASTDRADAAGFRVRCRVEPVAVTQHVDHRVRVHVRATLRLRATWTLSSPSRVLVHRERVVEPEEARAEIARAPHLLELDPYEAWFEAATAILGRAMCADLFVRCPTDAR